MSMTAYAPTMDMAAFSPATRHVLQTPVPDSLDRNHLADAMMHSIISQHLLASELGLLEGTIAQLIGSSSAAEKSMRTEVAGLQAMTQSDCKHLEVTLQAARCEHTAADTALQNALLTSERLLSSAKDDLFLAQDQLCQLVTSHN